MNHFGPDFALSDSNTARPLLFSMLLPPFLCVALVAAAIYQDYWRHGYNGQGPIALGGALFAIWQKRGEFRLAMQERVDPLAACASLLAALALALGTLLDLSQITALAIPLLAYAGLSAFGVRGWHSIAILLVLVIPLPGSIADAVLVPLKAVISESAASMLRAFGLPVAVSGVVIYAGYYEIQIADACSGIWEMLTLLAVGILFIHLIGFSSRKAMIAFACSIVPVALLINFLRVIALVFIVYKYGLAAHAVAHSLAEYVQVVLSVVLFYLTHVAAERFLGRRSECAGTAAR